MSGDVEDFVRTRYDGLRRFAYTICGSLFDADELAQTAMIELWRRWEVASANPDAYARRVIVTRNISRWRHHRRETLLDNPDTHCGDPVMARIGDPDLWHLLLQLNLKDRTIVVLHVLYQYTFVEIAGMFGAPRGTIASRYTRAMRTLRNEIDAESLLTVSSHALPRK